MKIEFIEGFDSDKLDFQNGEYSRSFERANQPFDVTDEEWKTLRPTGFFEPVKEDAPPQPDTQPEGAEHATGEQSKNAPPSAPKKRASRNAQNNQQSEEK